VTLGGGYMATPRGAGAPSLLQLLLSFPAPTHPWVPALLTSIRSGASDACLPALSPAISTGVVSATGWGRSTETLHTMGLTPPLGSHTQVPAHRLHIFWSDGGSTWT
jgi:hypothetical protein